MSSIARLGMQASGKFPAFWHFLSKVPVLRRLTNRLLISVLTGSTQPRPYPFSLWGPGAAATGSADYTSWTGLFDRTFTGRHLPAADPASMDSLPPIEALRPLFQRGAAMTPSPKSTALFGFFAQWFTDSFLQTDPLDQRKTTSNHEIDLCQIYGLSAADTRLLRTGKGGEMKTQIVNGLEYPPFLFERDGMRVKDEFLGLYYVDAANADLKPGLLREEFNTPERRKTLFASGLERGNSTVIYSTLNTIFLREHNRICRAIAARHPEWRDDDDRLFELARNTNIVCLLKIVIEDYINHLSSAHFRLFVDVGFAERRRWYRTNRIAAEFNLLYRWHPLVPNEFVLGGRPLAHDEFRVNNMLLLDRGVEALLHAAASQPAGRISLKNTAPFLVDADLAAMRKSRDWRIRPYNDYRERFGLPRVESFEELTGDTTLAAELQRLYGHVDRVDMQVGLFAEQRADTAVLGELMIRMVGVDAFSQALTNPLLCSNIYGPGCFSDVGLQTIEATSTLDDVARRNTDMGSRLVAFDIGAQPGKPVPGSYGLPFIGTVVQTLDFLKISGWEKFFSRRQRKYGNVFKVSLFKPTIAVLDQRAIAPLFADPDLVQDYGFSWAKPPLPLVGHVPPSVFESGPRHDAPKALYMDLLRARAPTLQPTFDRVLAEWSSRWLAGGRFRWADEVEDLSVAFLFEWMLGARPNTADVRTLYNNIFNHPFAFITRYFPNSKFSRSLRIYPELVRHVKESPGFAEIRELAARHHLTDEDLVAKQVLFVLGMNSYLGTQNLFKSVIGELTRQPALRDALRREVAAVSDATPSLAMIADRGRMPMLDGTIREILRLHAPVSLVFGRATSDRVIESDSGTYRVGKGELIMGVIPFAQRDPSRFPDPDRFDVTRYDDPVMSRGLIWPRGRHDASVTPTDRTCPGKDMGVLFAKLFCVGLLNFEWSLQEPPDWRHHTFELNVAAPKGLLEVAKFRAARAGSVEGGFATAA